MGRRLELRVARRVLDNGLTLVASRTAAAPTLALTCSFEVDQRHEDAGKAGIAFLVGETLEEGTERYTGDELGELVEGLGGQLRTAGSGASIQVAAADAKRAVTILSEVVRRPTFPAKGVRRSKLLAIADIKSDLDEPRTVAGLQFRALVYDSHPFGRPPKGTIESIESLTPAKLRAFHRKWFKPDNATIAAVGDVDPEAILDLLAKAFRSWKGRSPQSPATPELVAPQRPVEKHIPYDRSQVQVYLGHAGITREDPDFYKLLVMDHVLGTGPGFTSRISRKLRDEQGLCYAVGAGITGSAGKERGLFTAYIGTSPGQERTAIEGFLEEMRRIRDEAPAKAELADVKAYLTGSFVWALERNANLASFLVRAERFGLGDDYVERFPALIEAVTAADVREAAEAHLDPDHYYLVTLGP